MSVLEDFSNLDAKLYVDGALRASEASDGFDVIDPATESTLSHVAEATDAEIAGRAATGAGSWVGGEMMRELIGSACLRFGLWVLGDRVPSGLSLIRSLGSWQFQRSRVALRSFEVVQEPAATAIPADTHSGSL